MPRYLLGAVAVVVALVLLGVTVAVYRQWAVRPSVSGVAELSPGQGLNNNPVPGPEGPPVPTPRPRAGQAGERLTATLPSSATSFSGTLTADERREQASARLRAAMEELKYRLPSANVVRQLALTTDPALRLTAAQQEKVQTITAEMRPKVAADLQPLWAQIDQLESTSKMLVAQGHDDQARQMSGQYNEIYRQEAVLLDKLDEQYKALLSRVLRPEQMEMLSGQLTPEQTHRLYNSSPK